MKFTLWALCPPILFLLLMSTGDSSKYSASQTAPALILGLLWFVAGGFATAIYWVTLIVRRATRDAQPPQSGS